MKISTVICLFDEFVRSHLTKTPSMARKAPHIIYGLYIIFSLLVAEMFLIIPVFVWVILGYLDRNAHFMHSLLGRNCVLMLRDHSRWVLNTFLVTLLAFLAAVLAGNFEEKGAIIAIMVVNSFWVAYRVFYGWRCLVKGLTPVDIFWKYINKCFLALASKIQKSNSQGDTH